MADQTQNITQTITLDTTAAEESVVSLDDKMQLIAASTEEAQKGIKHVGDEYVFNSEKLQTWYDGLKKLGLEHDKLTVDLIDGMQSAAVAAKTAATAGVEAGEKIATAGEHATGSLHKFKLGFEDIGRLATGEKFGLRQFASNFALLGPAASIAAFALFEYGGELLKIIDPMNDAEKAQSMLNSAVSKGAEKAAEATVNVEKMNAQFANASTVSEREDALKEYNKTFGDTIGYAKDLNAAEANLAAKTEIYKTIMGERATIDALYAMQKEKIAEATKAQINGETSLWGKVVGAFKQYTGDIAGAAKELQSSNKDLVDDATKDANTLGKLIDQQQKKLQDNIKAAGGGTGKTAKEKEKTEHDNSIEELKRYIAESQKIEEDAIGKEITNENIKYDKLRADLVKHHHSTEELDKQHEENLLSINKKYADKEYAELKKRLDKEAKEKQAEEVKQEFERLKYLDEGEKKEDEMANAFFAKEKKLEEDKFQVRLNEVKKEYDALVKQAQIFGGDIAAITRSYQNQVTVIEKEQEDARLKASQAAHKAEWELIKKDIHAADEAANILDGILKVAEQRAGKHTQAHKNLAIATATIHSIEAGISAFAGFVEEFPGPVGIALGAAAAAGVVVDLFEQVKKIEAVQIPGGSGGASTTGGAGGGGIGNLGAGAPQIPQRANTTDLSKNSIGQIQAGQTQSVKAVVVESDVTNTQARTAGFRAAGTI